MKAAVINAPNTEVCIEERDRPLAIMSSGAD